jgi:hypothetical protein
MGHVDAAAASPYMGKYVEPHVAGKTPRILDPVKVGKQGSFIEEDEEYYSSSVFIPYESSEDEANSLGEARRERLLFKVDPHRVKTQ